MDEQRAGNTAGVSGSLIKSTAVFTIRDERRTGRSMTASSPFSIRMNWAWPATRSIRPASPGESRRRMRCRQQSSIIRRSKTTSKRASYSVLHRFRRIHEDEPALWFHIEAATPSQYVLFKPLTFTATREHSARFGAERIYIRQPDHEARHGRNVRGLQVRERISTLRERPGCRSDDRPNRIEFACAARFSSPLSQNVC